MDDLCSQFLDTFNVIENWMRNKLDAEDRTGFVKLVDKLAQSNIDVLHHSESLKRLAKLRNLIAHNHSRDQPLAFPTTHSVEQIERICRQLISPPLLVSVAATPVHTCRLSDLLGDSVRKMHEGVFSQLPIYETETCLGMLTAETVARWLAVALGDGNGRVDEETISKVIVHQEEPDNHTFVSQTATVADGLTAFDRFQRAGKRLEAILITNSGSSTGSLLGIVTIHDIPKLNQAIRS